MAKQKNDKLGVALVGLGQYSEEQLGPALLQTKRCRLAGIVTGTAGKAPAWKKKFDIPDQNVFSYENFDSIRDNPDIDIVYIVLPNSMHAEYTIRAARAGKHVICEKPMAVTVEECDAMVAACRDAGTLLSIGYRLHFEPYNIEIMRLGRGKIFGTIKKINTAHGLGNTQGWRLDKTLAGGGPLMDVGIYCVQACMYTTGMQPLAVQAQEGKKTNPEKFETVEESMQFQLEFPGGITAECSCSYSKKENLFRADAENGWFELSPAYSFTGIKGTTSEGDMKFPQVVQQALQMDGFADAIISKTADRVPGEMGREDVKILQAIYKAMHTGQRIEIS